MVKYSKEWKLKTRIWAQKHEDGIYKIHYIANDTEMSCGYYFTAKAAVKEIKANPQYYI